MQPVEEEDLHTSSRDTRAIYDHLEWGDYPGEAHHHFPINPDYLQNCLQDKAVSGPTYDISRRTISGSTVETNVASVSGSTSGRSFAFGLHDSSESPSDRLEDDSRKEHSCNELANLHNSELYSVEPPQTLQHSNREHEIQFTATGTLSRTPSLRSTIPPTISAPEMDCLHEHEEDEFCCFPFGFGEVLQNVPTSYEKE